MTKDRLGEFKKKRLYGSFRGSLRRTVRPLTADEEEEGMAPVLQLAKEIQSNVDSMHHNVAELTKLYSDIVTSPFAAPTALEKVENFNTEIRLQANEVKRKLNKLDPKVPKPSHSSNLLRPPDALLHEEQSNLAHNKSGAVVRLCNTHHVLLSTRLSAIIEEMNAAEVAFRNDSRKRLRRQMSITGAKVTADELDDKVDDNLQGNFAVFTRDIVTDFDAARQRKEELKQSIEREHCIVSLENSIKEMHTLFQDVALMVGRQGECVDSIQHHVHRTASFVEHGKNDLVKAKLMKKRSGKLKIILFLSIAILLIIALTVIFLFFHLA